MSEGLSGTTRPARYGAAVIDHVLGMFCMAVAGSVVGDYVRNSRAEVENIAIGLLVFLIYFFYFFLFEWLLAATPGKMFTDLTVRRTDGTRCGAKQIFFRTITRLLEVNPLLLGCLPAALIIRRTARRQRLGDLWADAVVAERSQLR